MTANNSLIKAYSSWKEHFSRMAKQKLPPGRRTYMLGSGESGVVSPSPAVSMVSPVQQQIEQSKSKVRSGTKRKTGSLGTQSKRKRRRVQTKTRTSGKNKKKSKKRAGKKRKSGNGKRKIGSKRKKNSGKSSTKRKQTKRYTR